MRQQLIRQLRAGLGDESVQKADELVRAHVADPAAQAATVDRFLDELDQMAPSEAVIETGATARLRAASREALAALVSEFDAVAGDLRTPTDSTTLAEELASVAKLLITEPALTKHLAEPTDDAGAKVRLVDTLLRGKVGDRTLDTRCAPPCRSGGPTESNLVDAIEHIARLALLKRAEVARRGRRGRGSAVPVRSRPRRRAAAEPRC